jgi:hypothetical protein
MNVVSKEKPPNGIGKIKTGRKSAIGASSQPVGSSFRSVAQIRLKPIFCAKKPYPDEHG